MVLIYGFHVELGNTDPWDLDVENEFVIWWKHCIVIYSQILKTNLINTGIQIQNSVRFRFFHQKTRIMMRPFPFTWSLSTVHFEPLDRILRAVWTSIRSPISKFLGPSTFILQDHFRPCEPSTLSLLDRPLSAFSTVQFCSFRPSIFSILFDRQFSNFKDRPLLFFKTVQSRPF